MPCSLTGQAQIRKVKVKDMSKTLSQTALQKCLFDKFELITKYCGATTVIPPQAADQFVFFSAEFKNNRDKPIMRIKLVPSQKGTFFIASAYVGIEQFPHPSRYADPETVISDLGKATYDQLHNDWTLAWKDMWELENAAAIEAFLRKYAALEELNDKDKLFGRLLRKDNS